GMAGMPRDTEHSVRCGPDDGSKLHRSSPAEFPTAPRSPALQCTHDRPNGRAPQLVQVDREYIAKLESEARSGTPQANFDAALSHHAASMFEMSRGDLEHALSDERTAVSYAPDEPALLMNVAYIYLRRNEYKQALDYLP